MAPSAQHPQYAKDEKVLCFHGELLYEAKILDSKHAEANDKKSPTVYLVHYKGWKNTLVTLTMFIFTYSVAACSSFFHSASCTTSGGLPLTLW